MDLVIEVTRDRTVIQWDLRICQGGSYSSRPFSILKQNYYLEYCDLNQSSNLSLLCNSNNGITIVDALSMQTSGSLKDGIDRITVVRNNEEQRQMIRKGSFLWEPISWYSCPSTLTFTLTAYHQKKSSRSRSVPRVKTVGRTKERKMLQKDLVKKLFSTSPTIDTSVLSTNDNYQKQAVGGSLILKGLNRLLEDGRFSDIQFIIKEEKFLAHKNILAAASPVLDMAFQSDWKEGQIHVMEITDTEPEVFQQFLKFVYTGEAPRLMEDNITEGLFKLANQYQVDFLKNYCSDCLLKKINLDNVIQLLIFSQQYSCSKLEEHCLNLVALKSKEVIGLPEWKELVHNYPELSIKVTEAMVVGVRAM